MKIGLVCPYNMFRGGGVQECVRAQQAKLRERGHEVYIITPQPREIPDGEHNDIIFLGGATDVKSFHTTAQVSFSANTDAVQEALDSHKFDILHFHEPWVPIVSRQLLSRSESINIATFHAKLPDTMMSKTIEKVITPYTKSVLKYLDVLTAVSDAAAQYVRGLTDQKINLIPNGIDLAKYQSVVSAKSETPSILYIGRLEKRKGIKYLIRAFALLSEKFPEVELIIAGDGPDKEKLQQLCNELELNNVRFTGYVNEAEKLKLLASSSVFCSPALYGESFGIVLLEAMAVSLPAVAGDNPGYVSVMQDTGKLSIVNPKHSDEFARRLELMLFNEPLRKVWTDWASEYVKQFDYDVVVDKYEALYQAALEKK